MREYTVTINEKDYKAKVAEINADQAVIVIDGKEYKVGLKEIGRKKDLLSGAHQRVESAQAPAASPAAPVKSLSVVSEPSLPTQRVEKVGRDVRWRSKFHLLTGTTDIRFSRVRRPRG